MPEETDTGRTRTVAREGLSLAKSKSLLRRAKAVMPGGGSTNSKRVEAFASPEVFPAFLDQAEGCRVRDVDGNRYIDFIAALAPIVLGHGDPRVLSRVRDQLGRAILPSLPTALEIELAELVIQVSPSAEMVRFCKTGAEAASMAVRTARTLTDRDVVLCCGYHGWHDWYAAVRWPNGIPGPVADLTHAFDFGDLDAAKALAAQHVGRVACIIVTPALYGVAPPPGFLRGLRALADEIGALLVFDEIITGFRWSVGGAQEVYDVTPDLTALGKAMANGFPVAALVGRRDIMEILSETWVSSTYAGECLSLVAAIETIHILREGEAIPSLYRSARRLADGLADIGARRGVAIKVSEPLPALRFELDPGCQDQAALNDAYIAACARRGVLIRRDGSGFSLCLMEAHEPAIDEALVAFDLALCDAGSSKVAR